MRTLKQTKVKGCGALGDFGNALLTVAHMGADTPEAAGAVTYGICLFVCPQKGAGAFRMNLQWVWSLSGLSLSAFSPAAINSMKSKHVSRVASHLV